MEIIERLQAVASVLTPDPELRQQLVREMAWYLVETKPADAAGEAAAPHRDADRDLVTPLCATLPARQREVFQQLLAGLGVRETGRLLGISHVAVIKHRQKILHRARKFLGPSCANSFGERPADPRWGGSRPLLNHRV